MSVKDFLKQRAVNIVVGGNYELPNWLDAQGRPRNFACRTSRVSPFRMIVAAPVVGKVGDRISSYFGDFGNLEGRISDTTAGEFLLELSMTGSMRQKMADKLSWLEKKQKDASVKDVRKQMRIIPAVPHSALTLADGSIHSCFIIDEYGSLLGLITLNDILTAIVGDLPEQYEDDYEIVEREDGSFLIDAQIPFYDFLSRFDKTQWMNEGEHEFDTIAGFVLHELERIPKTGDTFEWRGFEFEIVDMDGQRIDKLMVKLSEELKGNLEE